MGYGAHVMHRNPWLPVETCLSIGLDQRLGRKPIPSWRVVVIGQRAQMYDKMYEKSASPVAQSRNFLPSARLLRL